MAVGATNFSSRDVRKGITMRRFSVGLFSMTLGLTIYFSGCSERGDQVMSPSFSNDKEYFSSVLMNDDFFATEEPNLEDGDALPPEYGSGLRKEEAVIVPFRFGKKIEKVHRSVRYELQGDSVVTATITRTITGKFIIAGSYNSSATKPDTVFRKPFVETATRKAKFVRVAPPGSPPWKGWKLVSLSLIEGGTQTSTPVINRLVVYLQTGDSLIVNSPNDYFFQIGKRLHPVPDLHPDDPIKVQVTLMSSNPDSEVVVLRHGADHDGLNRLRARFHLVSQSPVGASYSRTYEITLRAHKHLGKFNAVTEAISHNSIYDDTEAFENNYWGIPYVVR